MSSTGPYSLGLMTRVLLGLGPPPTHYTPYKEPAPSPDKQVRSEPLSFAQSASLLSDVVNTYVHRSIPVASHLYSTSSRLDQQSFGWLPPLYPLSRPYVYQNLPPTSSVSVQAVPFVEWLIIPRNSIPIISDLLKCGTHNHGHPDIHQDGADSTNSGSTGSTPASSTFTRSPSPFVPVRMAEDETDPFEPSPLAALREKEKKRIRQSSGVKPKAKTPPQTHGLRDIEASSSSNTPLEMVRCQWEGCTKRLHVDYISVGHWGKHVREHYASEQDTIKCKWEGGCSRVVNKSSMWKHIVVHQPKFKIRCPRGCGVSTRADMMRRHLQTCNYIPGQAGKGRESDEEKNVEEGSHGGDYDDDGGDNEEEGRED